jgi:hypothetical protein
MDRRTRRRFVTLMKSRPAEGSLFPHLASIDSASLARYFQRLRRRARVREFVSLHSYRQRIMIKTWEDR